MRTEEKHELERDKTMRDTIVPFEKKRETIVAFENGYLKNFLKLIFKGVDDKNE